MLIHGGLMEIGGCLSLIPLLFMQTGTVDPSRYFSFIVPYFQENLYMMMIMGAIYGVIRVVGAIGLWRNRKWGLALSVINCVVTLILMMFMLPAGIMDGVFAGAALLIILMQYFGKETIVAQ